MMLTRTVFTLRSLPLQSSAAAGTTSTARTAIATLAAAAPLLILSASGARAQTPVLTYLFNNTLNPQQSGGPALSLLDPTGTSGYQTMDVTYNGVDSGPRQVLSLNGIASLSEDDGLQLGNTSLITDPTSYTFETVVDYVSPTQHGYRKILDVSNRVNDAGFYVYPDNSIGVFPNANGSSLVSNDTFYDIVLTQSGGVVTGYLNGVQQFTANTSQMDIPSGTPLSIFLDDTATSQQEYSPVNVALIRLYNGALSSSQVAALASSTLPAISGGSAPEPGSLALLAAGGITLVGAAIRRRRRIA